MQIDILDSVQIWTEKFSITDHNLYSAFHGYYKTRTGFVSPEGPKAQANKTCNNSMIFILLFVKNTRKSIF